MSWRRKLLAHQFRDVSSIFAAIRELGLGRIYNMFNRFAPTISPRTIPKPEIPRCLDYKYANQYYFRRDFYNSVHPPVVAPIAMGPSPTQDMFMPIKAEGIPPNKINFPNLPTPGDTWWWDGHFYYAAAPPKLKKTAMPYFRPPPICGPPEKENLKSGPPKCD